MMLARRGIMVLATLLAFVSAGQPGTPSDQPRSKAAPYSRISPHWSHIRIMSVDYRSASLSNTGEAATLREWYADHADAVLGSETDKRRNPNIKSYIYAIDLTVEQSGEDLRENYYHDLQRWFKQHGQYPLENAFLHDDRLCPAPQPLSEACRLQFVRWQTKRWAVNPADPGLVAYDQQRMALLGKNRDGIFLDEHESGAMVRTVCGKDTHTREYKGPNACPEYFEDVVRMLAAIRKPLGPGKLLMPNLAEYATDYDLNMAVAAGAAQLELSNDPTREQAGRWAFIERLLARGVFVWYSPGDKEAPPGYPKGNSSTPVERFVFAMLGNYYMLVPDPPDHLAFDYPVDARYRPIVPAQEFNVGRPLAPRRVFAEGVDGAGQKYRVYLREFQNAFVLMRPMFSWSDKEFGDRGAVTLRVPGEQPLVPLFANGTSGTAIRDAVLRDAEVMILLKP